MKAYIYNENTKEFLYEIDVEKSPLEENVVLMPNNATLEPIKENKKNYTQIFNGSKWEYIEDYRGQMVWKNHDEYIIIDEIGTIPSGYSLERPPLSQEELEKQRQEQFEIAFFETSLGWIRREVSMKDGSTKSFLTDLLPHLATGIPVLAYTLPDFTKEVEIVDYQQKVIVTEQFIQECKNQLYADFYGTNPE